MKQSILLWLVMVLIALPIASATWAESSDSNITAWIITPDEEQVGFANSFCQGDECGGNIAAVVAGGIAIIGLLMLIEFLD